MRSRIARERAPLAYKNAKERLNESLESKASFTINMPKQGRNTSKQNKEQRKSEAESQARRLEELRRASDVKKLKSSEQKGKVSKVSTRR